MCSSTTPFTMLIVDGHLRHSPPLRFKCPEDVPKPCSFTPSNAHIRWKRKYPPVFIHFPKGWRDEEPVQLSSSSAVRSNLMWTRPKLDNRTPNKPLGTTECKHFHLKAKFESPESFQLLPPSLDLGTQRLQDGHIDHQTNSNF